MSQKNKVDAPAQPAPVATPIPQFPPPAVVEENVANIISRHPDAISFDPSDEANEMLSLRCQTDPGIASQLKDGWRGIVNTWYVGTWQVPDEGTGEVMTLPSLVLLTTRNELVRLTGWPAINSWATLLRAAKADRIRQGLPVIIKRRPSGTAGHSYWLVLPDAS
jgi:hypothetical protein